MSGVMFAYFASTRNNRFNISSRAIQTNDKTFTSHGELANTRMSARVRKTQRSIGAASERVTWTGKNNVNNVIYEDVSLARYLAEKSNDG